jgi:hypothetical protein
MNALIEALHQDAANDLWFLDYHYSDENGHRHWCRNPMLRWNQVTRILTSLNQTKRSQFFNSQSYLKNKLGFTHEAQRGLVLE